ncbi:carboxylating nicotinate-nucleotide diphosphorylase [Aurantivibrio plasticivorans]
MINSVPSLDDYPTLKRDIERAVAIALEEDIGDGDITAQLIPADKTASATIITREDCVVCGCPWVEEVFKQLDPNVTITWNVKDGDHVDANSTLCSLEGNARVLLTGERTALNFLQLLSGTASTSRSYAELVKDSPVKILDTRKTIPGLRTAQKYAVACGGCFNHRMGLYDAFLIKENHIAACGGIAEAIAQARKQAPGKKIEVEVESITELEEAIDHNPDIVMLDNFSNEQLKQAGDCKPIKQLYEASGNIDQTSLDQRRNACVDLISSGSLTKNIIAIDLSLRIII